MSRHKNVKAISDMYTKSQNVDDELDYYDDEEEEESFDKEAAERQMREALTQAKEILGNEFVDDQIRDSLWHYYYDVDKTVNYLLKQKTAEQSKPTLKKPKEPTTFCPDACSNSFNAVKFFRDCPWFNVPLERQGEILIEPLYPKGGLLGGASQPPTKTSKLAALAAARKKKENDKSAAEPSTGNRSLALLDRLGSRPKHGTENGLAASAAVAPAPEVQEPQQKQRKYPVRQKNHPSEESKPAAKESPVEAPAPVEEPVPEPPVLNAPSNFAQTMLGSHPLHPNSKSESTLLAKLYRVFPETHAEDPFAGPSPDDVVAKAQSASKGLKSTKAPSSKDKTVNKVTEDLNKAKIDDTPRAKSKNLDVVAEYEKLEKKKAANFVVIGHVDAGKSTLMGRLLYDLKVIDQRTIDKYRKEAETIGKSSFALAWVLDEGSEERARGVTIDIATNRFETDSTAFTILDAPGHQDFVPNMIAGASQADFAVLVVDASTGSFESGLRGQTKEHALLVRSIGVQRMIVAVNKLDSVDWSQGRYDEIAQQVSAFLTAAGFKDSKITYVPCSGLEGDNITRRSEASASKWYKGPILLEQLEGAASPRTYTVSGPLRMPIADIYSGGVQYPLSTAGRITSGNVQVGDKIVCVPSNSAGYIKAIEVDGEPRDWAVAGMNAALHLSHIDPTHLKTGDVICSASSPLIPKTSFLLKVLVFEHVAPMYVSIIVGRLNVEGRVETMLGVLDKATGEVKKKNPKILKPGDVARIRVVVEVEGGLPIEEGTRVVLRSEGETIATGLVE